MGMFQSKLPLIVTIATPKSCIVNRQIGVKVFKFFVVSGPLPTGHMTKRMHNGHFCLCNNAQHYNGSNRRDSEQRHFVFVTLLDHGQLE